MADTTQVLRVNRLFDMSDLTARLLVVALRVLEGFVLSDRALEIGVNLFSADTQSTIVHDETDLFDREFLSLGEVKVDQGEPEAIEGNINSIAEMSDRSVSHARSTHYFQVSLARAIGLTNWLKALDAF